MERQGCEQNSRANVAMRLARTLRHARLCSLGDRMQMLGQRLSECA